MHQSKQLSEIGLPVNSTCWKCSGRLALPPLQQPSLLLAHSCYWRDSGPQQAGKVTMCDFSSKASKAAALPHVFHVTESRLFNWRHQAHSELAETTRHVSSLMISNGTKVSRQLQIHSALRLQNGQAKPRTHSNVENCEQIKWWLF